MYISVGSYQKLNLSFNTYYSKLENVNDAVYSNNTYSLLKKETQSWPCTLEAEEA